ncbi:uncharacterized protein LTR77_000746 [Saxophila tyrrhenica]|uniref:NmrA-like domain-containing protein n=1 Tax=Saxophila tyrrhenica TaxID=1690608 RepID=A0AAV9PP76_9PEZI|nr:hypothetical protein LTR77_000746 [Saxophila tyrrhenica]
MSTSNHVTNIAIVGAGGRSGKFIAEALIGTGKHKVTAISRADSTSAMPDGLHGVKKIDYDDTKSMVEALKGQEVLIVTMGVMAPKDTQKKLIDAAVEAEVPWIMPNEWGGDPNGNSNPQLATDTMIGAGVVAIRDYIKSAGGDKTHYVSLANGFWYEFSLAGTEARYGFDFEKKSVTFYDEGEGYITTSTFPQVGRAVAKLLSLKVLPEDDNDKSVCLSQWKNGTVYVKSFRITQKDMLASVLRVTGDKEEDWTITHEDVESRYKRGVQMMQKGDFVGFGILLYARYFFKDVSASKEREVDNEKLGLPEESLDEATEVAVGMAKRGENNAIH